MTITRRDLSKALVGSAMGSLFPIAFARPGQAASYTALALQVACDAVNQDSTRESARARMMASIERIGRFVAGSRGFIRMYNGTDMKLAVLPEYFLTGFPLGESLAEWRDKAAIDPDGPEHDALADLAQKQSVYLAGNAYETDPAFPELYFQVCFIIAPNGDTVHRYRRLISITTPTPYDVWDKFLDVYGKDALFPVTETELGNLATIASEEILYPEIARCLAMGGAEIFCHSTSEVGSPELTKKDIAKRARAIENTAYVISANTGGILGTAIPDQSADAMSKVIDPNGRVLSTAVAGDSMVAHSEIGLESLRAMRRRTGMSNQLSRQPFQLYADAYQDHVHHEPNGFLKDGKVVPPTRKAIIDRQRQVIQRLMEEGVLR